MDPLGLRPLQYVCSIVTTHLFKKRELDGNLS